MEVVAAAGGAAHSCPSFAAWDGTYAGGVLGARIAKLIRN